MRRRRGFLGLFKGLSSVVLVVLVIGVVGMVVVSGRTSEKGYDEGGLSPVAQWMSSLLSMSSSTISGPSGAVFTTLEDGSVVNANIYDDKRLVYLDGGPPSNAPSTAAALDAGNYYFQVTDPSGKTLLSTDPVKCREVYVSASGVVQTYVSGGRTYLGKGNKVTPCDKDGQKFAKHDTGVDTDHSALGAITVQLMPYADTPNKGGVYKMWVIPTGSFVGDPEKVDNPCGQGCFHGFAPAQSKTDNYKVRSKGRDDIVPPSIEIVKWYDYDRDGLEEVGASANEVFLTGWKVNVTDPLGVVRTVFTPALINPADEGTYTICEDTPLDFGWSSTSPVCVTIAVANGQSQRVTFGNVYQTPFLGGLTIGYWKTHSSLGPASSRDGAYGSLPITLGIAGNGIATPEVIVSTEAIAVNVLTVAQEGCSGDCLGQFKAQLLAAKLNCIAFPGFCDATFGIAGPTVQSVITSADTVLDDVAVGALSGEAAIKAVAEPLKNALDIANNNSHVTSLYAYSPAPGPYTFNL